MDTSSSKVGSDRSSFLRALGRPNVMQNQSPSGTFPYSRMTIIHDRSVKASLNPTEG